MTQATRLLTRFTELYAEAGGSDPDSVSALEEVFAALRQAKAFANDFQRTFRAERERAAELRLALNQLREAHEETAASEVRFRNLVVNSVEAIVILSPDGLFKYVSPSVDKLWGINPDSLLNQPFGVFVDALDAPDFERHLRSLQRAPGVGKRVELRLLDGERRPVHAEAVMTNLLGVPEVDGIVLNIRDVSERKELQSRVEFEAYHDGLTGLPNRRFFVEQLDKILRGDEPTALFLIDVDRFKGINDSLGHAAGDDLLIEVGRRLHSGRNPGGTLVARLGGDEFAVLVPGIKNRRSTALVGAALLRRFRPHASIAGRDMPISISVGGAWCAPGVLTASHLMRQADIALYDVKRAGRGRFVQFNRKLESQWFERLSIEADLRGAAGRGEFTNVYQPIFALRTGEVYAFEALARWNHPDRGLLMPDTFIGLAEEIGEINAIGAVVLSNACRALATWRRSFASACGVRMSVNVSPVQLKQRDFLETVESAVYDAGLVPSDVQLEVTESALVESTGESLKVLAGLKDRGFGIAMDDFGTGYSSLSSLSRLPLDVIKIDRSFMAELANGQRPRSLLNAIVKLGSALDLHVTAEGVESRVQEEALQNLGCDSVQGFLLGRPGEFEAGTALLLAQESQRTAAA